MPRNTLLVMELAEELSNFEAVSKSQTLGWQLVFICPFQSEGWS